ncbi:MAG: D-2-hydroxyacid dehydrogenase [Clostridia bacterium]|nr:D-2-hydroxyacid dehydrogenase [Clostridia bacterium]NCC43700.1 D-2-hydroxyacid dehydrogenase [Clostridia bacterium]
MKIVILEAKSLGDDISFTSFDKFGEVKVYSSTTREEMPERIREAQVVVANKLPICEETLKDAPDVELVCLTATGINNLDQDYLKKRGIAAYNVAGYSTDGVAQHTFALLFYVLEKLRFYDEFVKSGEYSRCGVFSYFGEKFTELAGKTWGILGLGAIGRKVAQIATAFGCKVIWCSASGSHYHSEYEQVEFDELLKRSDFLSIHAPLNEHTENLMNRDTFARMKSTAILLNLGRGPIVNDADLAEALEAGEIAAAGLDVLTVEPMLPDNPLLKIQDSRKLMITPHIGWAATETRTRCMEQVAENISRYMKDEHTNRVV